MHQTKVNKICSICKIEQPLNSFHKAGKYLKSSCKDCCKINYQQNRDQLNNYQKERYQQKAEQLRQYQKEWRQKNLGLKAADSAKRRATESNATPVWLTKQELDQIKALYLEARRLSSETKILWHVDHIVPLNGNSVCGLHVPWNLQVILATDNIKKGNTLSDKD